MTLHFFLHVLLDGKLHFVVRGSLLLVGLILWRTWMSEGNSMGILKYFNLCAQVCVLKAYGCCSQVSSQLPLTAATWWPLCSQQSAVRGSRRSCRCPITASRGWTLRAFCQKRQRRPHMIGVTAAVQPHWVWFCRWGEEIEQDWSWLLENSPAQPPLRSCRLSALCFSTPAHQNGSPALFKDTLYV